MRRKELLFSLILSLSLAGCSAIPTPSAQQEEPLVSETPADFPSQNEKETISPTPAPEPEELDSSVQGDVSTSDQSDLGPEEDVVSQGENGSSLEYKNALASAESHLKYSSYSYNGLIDMLLYDKYPEEAAIYAADNCGADWNEQALLSAEGHLKYSAYS